MKVYKKNYLEVFSKVFSKNQLDLIMGKKMMLDVNNLMKKKQNQKSGKRYKPMELNILQGGLVKN